MSKKRIIMPNTKVDKNNIGKRGLEFNEIYVDNIIVDKINNKKVDPDYYLKDNFCIIYPNGGSKEKPANISYNTRYIEENPYKGYYVNCKIEVYWDNQWGDPGWHTYYTSGSSHVGLGVKVSQLNDDTIIVQTGNNGNLTYYGYATGSPLVYKSLPNNSLPCRVLIWKVGKIK